MVMKRFLMVFGALLAGCLSAATLNVDLTVTHGVYSKDEADQGKKVVFLIIDRSASMGFKTLKGGRTPNEALIESLKLQLAAIPHGTEVRVVPFSSAIWDVQVYKSLDERARKSILDFVTEKEPKGLTVLYDAQDLVFGEAVKILDGDANAEVRVLVYTDGEHQTPCDYEGEYKACYQNVVKKLGRRRFEDNPNYRNDLETARQKFKSRFKGLVSRLNLEVEYEWLSETDKPEPEMVTKASLPTELSAQTPDLANPFERPDQTIGVGFRLPISDKCWEEVKGKPVSLVFEVGGKYVEDRFTLDQGRHNVKLSWPSLPTDSPATARLLLARLPGGAKFDLKEPKPLLWRVPAQGRVSVEVMAPIKEAVVAVGTEVRFVAKASDQADIAWTFGRSLKSVKGSSVCWKPDAAGIVQYCATATKTGFKEASATGRLEVIPTGVEVTSADGRHEVGKKSLFKAKAIGPCQRYAWTVDGRRVPGEKATFECVFEASGSHQVGVTAFYKNNLQAISAPKTVAVAKAPLVKVLAPAPYDGDVENATFQAEKPIDLAARVEGDLTEVVWEFKLKDKVIASFPTTVKDGNVVGRYTPPKGGYYDVIATGKGPAGEKSATVPVFVKSAEVRVDITSPKSNQDVETGKAFTFEAVVKGSVKSVRWKVVDRSTVKPVSFGQADVSAVVAGKTSITAKLPPELGNASVSVEAEPVLEDAELAETVAPSIVLIEAKTPAGIVYTPETLGLNWKKVKYGEQVKLAVTTSGAIKKVAWFSSDASGKEVALGKEGTAVNVDIVAVRGQSERLVDYFAKGLMPDGSWLPTEERITIVGCGDKLKAVLNYKEESSYGAGGNLHIDGKGSTGSPDSWTWKVNGKIQPQFEDQSAIDVDLPNHPCELIVELTVASEEGVSTASTKTLKVRLWWLAVPAVVLLLLLLYMLCRVCLGNGPKRWSFYTWEGPVPKRVGGGYPDELGDAYMNKGVELTGIRKWNYWTKCGKIRMGDMLMIDGDEGNVWLPFAEEEFEVKDAGGGAPIVRPPEGKFDDVTAEVNVTGESPYFLFRYIGMDYSDEIAKGHDNVRVRVVTDGGSGILGGLAFLASLGLALYGFVWFCMKYAI